MTGDEAGAGDKQRAAFAGIVLLLRQLAHQLLEHGNKTEARGIVDGIEAVSVKTRGNLDEGEARFLEDVLYELRMAVVAGPGAKAKEEAAAEGASGGDEAKDREQDAERPPEPAGE